MILEFEDFVKSICKQEILTIKNDVEDGEFDIIEDGNHKYFNNTWQLIGDFRRENNLNDRLCYDENGKAITPKEYRSIINEILVPNDPQSPDTKESE